MDSVVQKLVKSVRLLLQKSNSAYDTTGTVRRVEDGIAWVHIDGGVDETPFKLTINAQEGDSVQVRVANGRGWLVGNMSAPPTDDKTAEEAKATATKAVYTAETALEDAVVAHEAAESATASAATAGRAASVAQAAAEAAQETANTKRTVFVAQPMPPYHVGDLWVREGDEEITSSLVTDQGFNIVDSDGNLFEAVIKGATVYVCVFARSSGAFVESDWSLAATDNTSVNELREWFWHDATGAHVLGDATGYRNDITSTGMQIIDTSTETSVATFGASGAQIGKSGDINAEVDASGFTVNSPSGTDVAHLGYGSVVMSDGTTSNGPFYTLGMRLTGAVGYDSMVIGAGKATKFQSVGMCGGEANGERSIACGTSVLADSDNQAVFGIFNESDANNTYAFIIGNGSGVSNRSNAFAVDWNGNIYPAGVKMTDFVIDEGTSGSWTYRKWHSGKIEAWFEGVVESSVGATKVTAPIYRGTWSLSIPSQIGFVSAPHILITNNYEPINVISVNGKATSATAISGNFFRVDNQQSTVTLYTRIYAWGVIS